MSEYKDISTAPTDKVILIKGKNFGEDGRGFHYAVVIWNDDFGFFVDANIDPYYEYVDFDAYGSYRHAFEWMEIPK